MRESHRYQLTQVDRARGESRLMRDTQTLEGKVQGVVLEAQFELEDGTSLVWLTDDCPYEEGLSIYLLSASGEPVDALLAGAPYTPGLLRILATGERWVNFSFFDDARHRLTVDEEARFQRPSPSGWHYARWFARHLLEIRPLWP